MGFEAGLAPDSWELKPQVRKSLPIKRVLVSLKTIWEDDQRVWTILLLHNRTVNFQIFKNMCFLLMISSAWLKELIFVSHKAFLMQKENRSGVPASSACFLILQRCEIPGEDRLSDVCWPSPGGEGVAHLHQPQQGSLWSIAQSKLSLVPWFHAELCKCSIGEVTLAGLWA